MSFMFSAQGVYLCQSIPPRIASTLTHIPLLFSSLPPPKTEYFSKPSYSSPPRRRLSPSPPPQFRYSSNSSSQSSSLSTIGGAISFIDSSYSSYNNSSSSLPSPPYSLSPSSSSYIVRYKDSDAAFTFEDDCEFCPVPVDVLCKEHGVDMDMLPATLFPPSPSTSPVPSSGMEHSKSSRTTPTPRRRNISIRNPETGEIIDFSSSSSRSGSHASDHSEESGNESS
ncbi:hypothetical protein BKA69DRAFT_1128154 [Paraphysoderma sedebokerense]|nr:hypothetical protein BKA69DRAFT_1128154 [Paraphysoderma sedebokerense]